MVHSISKNQFVPSNKVLPSTHEDLKNTKMLDQQEIESRISRSEESLNKEDMQNELDKLNQILDAAEIKNITFKIHDESDQLYALVIDRKTNEIVKTLPPEHFLELSAKMKNLVGMFIDEKI